MRDQDQRRAALQHFAHALEALLLERRVAYREHLVDDEDVRLQERAIAKPIRIFMPHE